MWERVPDLRPQESEGFNSISSAFRPLEYREYLSCVSRNLEGFGVK